MSNDGKTPPLIVPGGSGPGLARVVGKVKAGLGPARHWTGLSPPSHRQSQPGRVKANIERRWETS